MLFMFVCLSTFSGLDMNAVAFALMLSMDLDSAPGYDILVEWCGRESCCLYVVSGS